MIEVTKLDGSSMHLNEDLITRVELAVSGQSALYMLDGGHIIVANDPSRVVALIRAEKVDRLREALHGPEESPSRPDPDETVPGVTRLSQVRGQ